MDTCNMIPTSNLYSNTVVDSIKSQMEISKLLSKFNIYEKRLTQQGPTNSYFEFIIHKDNQVSLLIKIKIPFIEKEIKDPENKGSYITVYDEPRSFRYFYHYLKALLSAKEAEMYSIEEIFMPHIVMPLPNGSTITMGEQLVNSIAEGKAPMIEGFNIISAPTNALENKKIFTLHKKDDLQ